MPHVVDALVHNNIQQPQPQLRRLADRSVTTTTSSTTISTTTTTRLEGSLDVEQELGMMMMMMKDFSELKKKRKKKRKRSCRCPGDDEGLFLEDFVVEEDDHVDGADLLGRSQQVTDAEDADETRREVLFSTIGAVWAAVTTTATVLPQQPAYATAGVDANMAFPDIVGGMADRANKQCLVESLGNRECLVYQDDSSKFLYQGADSSALVERLRITFQALEQIPPLVETKQWTKINGLLTGPMGQLSRTLTDIVKLSPTSKNKAQAVKNDVLAMGTATQQRQPTEIMKYQQLAIKDLTEFIQAV